MIADVTVPRRRILFVAHSSLQGGAELCLDTTLRHLDRKRFEPITLFPFDGPMAHSARREGMDVIVRPMCHWLYFRRNFWYWKNLAGRLLPNTLGLCRLIRKRQIDLVYTNTSAVFEGALAAQLCGVPHVWHVHEVLQNGNAMEQLLPLPAIKKLIYWLSDRVIFESNAARQVFEQSTPRDKSSVVYNGLRLECNVREELRISERARFGLGPRDRVVGFIGQFIERKNPLLLIRAMARLKHVTDLKCVLVGSGPLEETLRRQIDELGLQHCCQIVKFQEDIHPVFNVIDVLVLPSRQESFGLVLVESAAFRKPVIACHAEGPNEIIVDGVTGFLVRQDDPVELSDRIELVLGPEFDRSAIGNAAAKRAKEWFDPLANTRKLEVVFEELVRCRAAELPANIPAVAQGE